MTGDINLEARVHEQLGTTPLFPHMSPRATCAPLLSIPPATFNNLHEHTIRNMLIGGRDKSGQETPLCLHPLESLIGPLINWQFSLMLLRHACQIQLDKNTALHANWVLTVCMCVCANRVRAKGKMSRSTAIYFRHSYFKGVRPAATASWSRLCAAQITSRGTLENPLPAALRCLPPSKKVVSQQFYIIARAKGGPPGISSAPDRLYSSLFYVPRAPSSLPVVSDNRLTNDYVNLLSRFWEATLVWVR